jgi:trk system potassium uptake protein TrkH
MLLSQKGYRTELDARTSLALVTLAWVLAGVVGALPFYFSGTLPSFTDALFESISGFTGTGASVIRDVETVDRGLLLWRSLSQWVGGMGIIVFFVALLPALGLGSVQLFKAEVAGPQKDRLTPRVTETARKLWILYVALTAALILCLYQAGMPLFDAANHAFATLATGGFSIKNSGIAHYQSAAIDYLIAIFMVIGAVNFGLHYRVLVLKDMRALLDTELRWFLTLLGASTLIIAAATHGTVYESSMDAVRYAFFTVTSVASSTGFTNHDFVPWPSITHVVIVLLMVMGGMSGSTAGGIKCIRIVAAFKQLHRQLKQVVHPKAVIPIKANNHIIPESVIDAIWGLIFLYLLVFTISALILTGEGLDLVTATTGTFSALSNIGPGLGDLGPTANYADLSVTSKITLIGCMLLGRLEFFTVLVLFTPTYWRR